MSDQTPAPEPAPTQAELKRQAREARAIAKANRGWFARHKILTALGVMVLLAVVVSLSSGGDGDAPADVPPAAAEPDAGTDGPTEEPAEEAAPEEPAGAAIGEPVRDGKFEFTVTAVEPGVAEVGSEYLNKQAQGQFVLVHVTVENIGDESQYFFADNQYAFDADGRRFSADSEASIYLEDSQSFVNEINPGNTVQGVVVFDVPADVTLTSLELHDSAFSGGVTVELG